MLLRSNRETSSIALWLYNFSNSFLSIVWTSGFFYLSNKISTSLSFNSRLHRPLIPLRLSNCNNSRLAVMETYNRHNLSGQRVPSLRQSSKPRREQIRSETAPCGYVVILLPIPNKLVCFPRSLLLLKLPPNSHY